MVNVIMFSKTSDILKLTGLPDRNTLWDAGFNLDDWDAGFSSDQRLHEEVTYVIPKYCEGMFPEKYGRVIDFMHVYEEEMEEYGDQIEWLSEEKAVLKGEKNG